MKKYVLLVASILSANTAQALQSPWMVNEMKDKMTDKVVSYRASSDWFETNDPMLAGSKRKMYSWVNVQCNKSEQWAFIAFSKKPYMGLGTIIEREVVTRIKFDDHLSEVTLQSGTGQAPVVFVDNADEFIKLVRNSNTIKLEFPWYQYGNIYLDYDSRGSDPAISEAFSKCKTLK